MDNEIKNICYRITRRCNWKCHFCQAPPDAKELSTVEHLKILRRLAQQRILSLKITGGEPLLRNDLEAFIDESSGLGFNITLCSNGSMFRPSVLSRIADSQYKIKISLHSLVGNSLMEFRHVQQAIKGIERARTCGIHTSIHCITTSENRRELNSILYFATQLGVSKVTLIPLVPRGRSFLIDSQNFLHWQHVAKIAEQKKDFFPELKVSFLDLYRKKYYVLETDGCLYLQAESENQDVILHKYV
ncbi:radical SAM protein [Desulfomicrobium baculatum]|uniref:Radical SAM domain protein n=1 Tax=Desulfomicrobium baculatum (strain DSM 4028 / VKM B-1378 / X) TaxID=525897 RepID=C7LRZ4_DESBD|nr:radical SAM protein [Desulfomicrobium baculatum]ACU89377.1 Radical SAM domain protein [Desulfomicrobium baculatum DSM 4028]